MEVEKVKDANGNFHSHAKSESHCLGAWYALTQILQA